MTMLVAPRTRGRGRNCDQNKMDGNWFAKLTGTALLSMRSVHKMIIIIEWNLSGAHVGGTDCHVNKGKFFSDLQIC